jgi:D-methionine transport system ATP-binding protein
VYIDGQKLDFARLKTQIPLIMRMGFVFQHFNLFPHMTVLDNLTLGPIHAQKKDPAESADTARALLKRVGLEDKIDSYPAQLSGGQKQRVAIARALASNPDMLLCDEATSALDPMTTQSILELLQEINRNMGITVVLITHEMAVIRQICNKVAILDFGKLVEEGTVDSVFLHTKSAAGRRLFGILPQEDITPPQPALRIVFDGEAVAQPIISRLVRECGADVNILSADMRQFSQKVYGQMLIQRPEDIQEQKRIIDYLTNEGLTVEEVQLP